MFISLRKKVLILGILSVMFLPTQAMQRSTARALSSVVAIGCAVGSYSIFNEVENSVHPVIFASVSGAITYMAYSYLYGFTPEGRLNRAIELLHKVNNCKLSTQSFFDEKSFFDLLHECYLTEELPFISAYNHLISVESMCREAISLLHKALSQISQASELEERCNDILFDATRMLTNIAQSVKKIKEHRDYLPQLQLYKEWFIAEKQVFAQEQIAFAQQQIADAQLQMANAKQSSTNLKWYKVIFG